MDFSHIVFGRNPLKYDMRDFRLSDFITPAMRKRAKQTTSSDWAVARILNQGSTPHCVGFAWCGFGISLPVFDDWDNSRGDEIYYQAKIFDGEPGQENGSTTRSGVQAFQYFGLLSSYAFATSLDDIVTWLLVNGPVVTGTNWYNQMMSPDSTGLIKVGGSIVGGHEWMLSGVDTVTRKLKGTNSWGTEFGINGQFFIGFDDYQRLLNEQGDACTAVEIVGTPVPPPVPAPSGCLSVASLGLFRLAHAMMVAAQDLARKG